MIYVYDILVNLNEEVFDFYDWEESDDFSHVRRTPLFKVSSDVYFDLVTKKIKLLDEYLSMIKDKTQIFSSRNIEVLPYAAIFTDGVNAIMVSFSDNGYSKKKSKFLVNEELEIVDLASSVKVSKITYNVIKNKVNRNKMLRSEKSVINDILEELEILKDDKTRIDYLYYEWFERQDGSDKYNSLVNDLKKGFTNKHMEFLDLLNLLTISK